MVDDFIEAESYSGFKEGYVYKMGRFGLGYYEDKGPMGPFDDFDVNKGIVAEKKPAYDMDSHARGESAPEPPKEPGHGRVGALGHLLAGTVLTVCVRVAMFCFFCVCVCVCVCVRA